jgi:hypothetical protein
MQTAGAPSTAARTKALTLMVCEREVDFIFAFPESRLEGVAKVLIMV